ncbi:MAG: 2OG-Fe(II) oxygenase [Gammaproteobacteria bacterium]|nr:2OG-Fe(II) oxygenase [Gammaproteobacteria bacterium]
MVTRFIDSDRLTALGSEEFRSQEPNSWLNERLLRPEGFDELCRDFPSLDRFEFHQDLAREGGQRPHDRYYLAYESSIYDQLDHSQRCVRHDELPNSWQGFIEELDSPEYRGFVSRMLGVSDFTARFAWHVGVTHSEVSPHRDSPKKLGTHIFYFNTDQDWDPSWGGETLVLEGKLTSAPSPDFSDFSAVHGSPISAASCSRARPAPGTGSGR